MPSAPDAPPPLSGIRYLGLTVTDVRRSARWYERVLGFPVIKEVVQPDGWLYEVQLHHQPSDTTIGLIQHRRGAGGTFDEMRPGLDHVELNVSTLADLDAWVARLDALGIAHGEVGDRPNGRMVTFRDPDHIQLELYWRKPRP